MGSKYKQCPKGHLYQGDVCSYCETELFPVGSYRTRTDVEHKSVVPPYRETETISIPLCPHCGEPIRKIISSPYRIISIDGGARPWNYGWKGRCESCGYDFTLTMRQKLSSHDEDRCTIVKVAFKPAESGYVDVFMGLSGVEIEQRNSIDGVKKTFISTNELKYLISALKDSPILEQKDWYEDRTRIYKLSN